MNYPENDTLFRFLFEDVGVRGNLIHLDSSWRAILERHDYPESVIPHLGEMTAASVMLSSILKLDGSLIIQAQGPGPVTALVAQATNDRHFRALARWNHEPGEIESLADLTGNGHLALTIDPMEGERYQGVVELKGENLSDAIEGYFEQSEQLKTMIRLVADGDKAAGILIQVLPSEQGSEEDWRRISMLTETVTDDELLNIEPTELIHRLYHEEDVRLFEPEPVAFRCSCSHEKVAQSLKALGKSELDQIIEAEGAIETTCEFCNRTYRFDSVDVEQLFSDKPEISAPAASQ